MSNFWAILSISAVIVAGASFNTTESVEERTVKTLQEYLRIDTSVVKNLELAVDFWRGQASALGLGFAVYYPAELPVVVLTLEGSDPSLPSIMVNSHMDVVVVEADKWTYPPFSAHIDEEGNIYGRGAQDCKGLAILQLETLRYFKENNITPLRTIHMTLMPDEETGGFNGIVSFIKTQQFADLHVGFALDEGIADTSDDFLFLNIDKRPWQISFVLTGESGHGAVLDKKIAVEKVSELLSLALAYRKEQSVVYNQTSKYDYGAYTVVNVNYIRGGVETNVIPSTMEVRVDMRLARDADTQQIGDMVQSWITEIGGAEVQYIRQINESVATPVDDTNIYWGAIEQTLLEMNQTYKVLVCPATSDMLHVRALGIPAIGFVPNTNTTWLPHATNEYINTATLLSGVEKYRRIVASVASLPKTEE